MAGGTAPASPWWCHLGGERGIRGMFLAGALGESLRCTVLPPFLSQLLGEHLSCCVEAAAVWGHHCGLWWEEWGWKPFTKWFLQTNAGFFPLHKAYLRCFPKLSTQICKRSSPVPQNKLDEICQ